MDGIKEWLLSGSVKRAVRTFVIAFLFLFVPGALGWLNDLTSWAKSEGQSPLPDYHTLAFLGIQAITAAFVAVGNLLWNFVEDASGHAFLRDPGPNPLGTTKTAATRRRSTSVKVKDEGGYTTQGTLERICLLVAVIGIVLILLSAFALVSVEISVGITLVVIAAVVLLLGRLF